MHWPFCAAKCPYCDFNSHVRVQIEEESWTRGIARELDYVRSIQGSAAPAVDTVFFGGGTPSLMSGRSVGCVLEIISRLWCMSNEVEVTLESNPASADAGRFRDYRAAGVNRLSVGVQALDDADLKMLGRLHDADEAKTALSLALSTFERVSFDLIYARPDQTPGDWRAELTEALAFGSEHLSLYQLTIEPKTPFFALAAKGVLKVPGDGVAGQLYAITQELTEAAGLPAYEISNHALPGAECRHNLLYWRYGAYAGVGPGAHGRLDSGATRYATSTECLPERWLNLVERNGHGFTGCNPLSRDEAAREHLMMSLRLAEGIDCADYMARSRAALDRKRIEQLSELGLVRFDGMRLAATPQGRLVLNQVIAILAD